MLRLLRARRLAEARAELDAFVPADAAERVEHARLSGFAAFIVGDDRAALPLLLRALRGSRSLHATRVRIRNNLATVYLRLNRMDVAEKLLRRALADIRLHPEARGVAEVPLGTLAVVYRRRGMIGAAIRTSEDALAGQLAGEDGMLMRRALRNNLALILMDAGDLERAGGLVKELFSDVDPPWSPSTGIAFALTAALLELKRGDPVAARRQLSDAERLLGAGDQRPAVLIRLYAADCARLEGDSAAAGTAYSTLAEAIRNEPLVADLRSGIARRAAEIALEQGHPRRALEWARRAAREGRPLDRHDWAAALRVLGTSLARLGRVEDARATFARALSLVVGAESACEESRLRAELARLGFGDLCAPAGEPAPDRPRVRRVDREPAERTLRDGRRFLTHDRDVIERLELAAADALPVFIVGETGTGKDLLAHLVHEAGPRREHSFVIVDCATLSETLAEAELFGAARGSFSGAVLDRAGLVAEADGGTLFLDEFPELSLALQSKLLRFLGDGSYRRVGESRPRRARVRVIAATNRDPDVLLEHGRLRADLFFRLNGHRLQLRPLRERPDDVVAIATALARGARLGGIRPEAIRLLQAHAWPGNVRELEMEVRTAAARTAPGAWLGPEDFRRFAAGGARGTGDGLRARRTEAERAILEQALHRHAGNIAAAARELGISRQAMHKALRKRGVIGPSGFPAG